MGSSSSHLGSRPPRSPRAKRSLLSVLVCGGSTSHAQIEMEDDPVLNKFQIPKKESGFASGAESRFSRPKIEHAASSESDIEATADSSFEDSSGSVETSNHGKGLSRSKEIIPPRRLSVGCRSRDIVSTSYEDRSPSGPISTNGRANFDGASGVNNIMDKDVSQICPRVTQSCIPSLHELSGSFSDDVSVENHASEVTSVHDSVSRSASIVSDSPVNFDLLRNDNPQDETPSGLGFIVSDREQGQRDESVGHRDVMNTSSNILSSSNADVSNREARRNSRRLFWDAFSRRNSRRHSDSRTFVFASNESDDLGSHDRWVLDFNGDVFDDGFRGDTGFLGSSTHSINERRWNSRSEIWERLRGGRDGSIRTNICPSGLHPNGTCTCDSILMAEESSARASISRIVMLAEALFEVLDEIHRQPASLSLSMVSLLAPELVVDSLPVKNHRKTPKTGDDNDDQCYICLVEYEEGDKIRVLPCHHEYHLSCIDKWLKEIHGVCPLCRGDVREGFSAPNPELHSL